MKTERRHELETNTLADALGRAIERIKPYSKAIVGIVVAVAVVIGVTAYLSRRARTQSEEGWDRYFEAMREGGSDTLIDVAEQYRGTPAGAWSRLRVADIQFFRGSDMLFQDRAQANDQLRRAVENYLAVLDQADADMLQQRARFGLGQAYESLNELDKARTSYQTLVDSYHDSALSMLADRRLKDLDKRSTRQFYDWFASQDPAPAFEPPTGDMPEFDLDSLPDPPDDQSSGIFEIDAPGSVEPTSARRDGESPSAETGETTGAFEPPSSEPSPSEENSPDESNPPAEDPTDSDASGSSSDSPTGQTESRPEDDSPS